MASVWPAPPPPYAREASGLPQILSGVGDWIGNNGGLLQGIGAGLLSGDLTNLSQTLPAGIQMDRQSAEKAKANALAESQQNATLTYLAGKYPDLADAVKAGMPVGEAWSEAMKRMSPQGSSEAPSSVREWQYFSGLPEDQRADYLRMKRANPYLDIGTGFVQPDPVNPGQFAGGPIVKNNEQAAYDSTAGAANAKVDVENQNAAASIASKLPGLEEVVGKLSELGKKATYTYAGQAIDATARQFGNTTEGALARTEYMSMVDNQVLPLLRDTFGAAFTQKEGEALRATLGAPDLSPAEKDAVLQSFIEQKKRDVQALQSRLPGGATPSTGDPELDAALATYGG